MDVPLADDAGDRRQVDHRAAAGLFHRRDAVLHAEEDAGRIDPHQPVPGRRVIEILLGRARDSGIVDQHVEMAMVGQDAVDEALPLPLVGDVEMGIARLPARLVDVGDHRLALLVEQVGDDNRLGAFAGKQAGSRGTHAAGRTTDQGNLVLHAHRFSPSR